MYKDKCKTSYSFRQTSRGNPTLLPSLFYLLCKIIKYTPHMTLVKSSGAVYTAIPVSRGGWANISLHLLIRRQQTWTNGTVSCTRVSDRANNRLHINPASQSIWHSTSQPKPPSPHPPFKVSVSCCIPMSQGNSFVRAVCSQTRGGGAALNSHYCSCITNPSMWKLNVELVIPRWLFNF